MSNGQRIIQGLKDAIAYARGARVSPRRVFEATAGLAGIEDNGHVMIVEVDDNRDELFMCLYSSTQRNGHTHDQINRFLGKRVRVIIEVID